MKTETAKYEHGPDGNCSRCQGPLTRIEARAKKLADDAAKEYAALMKAAGMEATR